MWTTKWTTKWTKQVDQNETDGDVPAGRGYM